MNNLELKNRRKEIGLTQQELADLLGVSKNTIVNYEKGLKIPESKIPLLIKTLYENNNIYKDEKVNIVNEPQEEYQKITGFDKKIIETIDKITAKQDELIKTNSNSEKYKTILDTIELYKEKLEIIKLAKKNH